MAKPMRVYDAWRRHVLEQEGLGYWNIAEGEPYCWIGSKNIMVYPDSDEVAFLHEVAHALYPYLETLGKGQHFHGSQWGSTFGKLVRKYMEPRRGLPVGPPVEPESPNAIPEGTQEGDSGQGA